MLQKMEQMGGRKPSKLLVDMMEFLLRIRTRKYVGLADPLPDLLVTSTDPASDPSIIMQNSKK
jgi:hypothetical protein